MKQHKRECPEALGGVAPYGGAHESDPDELQGEGCRFGKMADHIPTRRTPFRLFGRYGNIDGVGKHCHPVRVGILPDQVLKLCADLGKLSFAQL